MTRPLTVIYSADRDYSSLPEISIANEEDENKFIAAFQRPLVILFCAAIATLSIIDLFRK